MSVWICERCGRKYTFDEFIQLPSIPVNPKRPEEGTFAVCKVCGYVFLKDARRKQTEVIVEIGPFKTTVCVSTIYLESPINGMLYETMIFADPYPNFELRFEQVWRYKTWEEAINHHEEIVNKLRNGEFITRKVTLLLELLD